MTDKTEESATETHTGKSIASWHLVASLVVFGILFVGLLTLTDRVETAKTLEKCHSAISLSQREMANVSIEKLEEYSKALRFGECNDKPQAVVDRQHKIIDQVIIEKYDAANNK